MLTDRQKTAFGYVWDALIAFGVGEPQAGRRWMKRAFAEKTLPVKKLKALQEKVEACRTPNEATQTGLALLHEMVGLTWRTPCKPTA